MEKQRDHSVPGGMKYLCSLDELVEGEVVTRSIGRRTFVAIRSGGNVSVISSVCPHDGTDLSRGAACGGEIVCPSHFARFDCHTGTPTAPALDGPTIYESVVEDGDVYVGKPRENPPPSGEVTSNERIVIIGGGAAGLACAESLRRLGYTGRVLIVTAEASPPYDRTTLSKSFLATGGETHYLRDPRYLESISIELRTGTRIAKIRRNERIAETSTGEEIRYDFLVIATGSDALRMPEVVGSNEVIHTIRSVKNASNFSLATAASERLHIVGAGFVALEVAAVARNLGKEVTVVCTESFPYPSILGEELGRQVYEHHRRGGVDFLTGREVEKIDGDSRVIHVADGEVIPFELLLLATGAKPRSQLLADSGLGDALGVEVDRFLRTRDDRIFAAGDIAKVKISGAKEPVRFEHWAQAQRQGTSIARTICGSVEAYDDLPFFWSTQGSLTIRSVGFTRDKTDRIIRRRDDELLVGYFEDGALIGVASIGYESALLKYECLLRRGDHVDSDHFDQIARS